MNNDNQYNNGGIDNFNYSNANSNSMPNDVNNGYNNPMPNDMNSNASYGAGNYKLILKRQKAFVASLIAFKIFIDNVEVGKIKNGETISLEITPGQHEISINKNNPIIINVIGDMTADVVVFGSNNFGITNINGQGQNISVNGANNNYGGKSSKQTNGLLIATILFPIISVIMYFTLQYVIAVWFYGILIGYGLVNLSGLKNVKDDAKLHSSILIKNIIAIVINIISIILTMFLTIGF